MSIALFPIPIPPTNTFREMDQGYKHFSHSHNLVIHQMSEGTEFSCSCCNSPGTGITYVCWQCSFFVHEQCFKASRFLKHPSHPHHPLTLVPYPTYPSNSFFCNSCQITGTGFSYSCADCEFNLHVHCAYSTSGATGWNEVPNSNVAYVPFIHAHNIPYTPPYSNPNAHYHGHQNLIPTPPNPSMAHKIARNGQKDESIIHISHPHNLSIVNLKEVVCSGCEDPLIGKGYSCSQPNCNFYLHESCFHLKKQILHKSHTRHPLNLLPLNNKDHEFTCNACFGNGRGFSYHCSVCKFDLHIQCSSLPETMKWPDHEHVQKLSYSSLLNSQSNIFICGVCDGIVPNEYWVYYCETCGYGTHLDCADRGKRGVIDTQVKLQKFQLEMQQLAQMIAVMGESISSLVG